MSDIDLAQLYDDSKSLAEGAITIPGYKRGGWAVRAFTESVADHVVDLGPGAGQDGGRVVFEGTPADLVAACSTLTGQHLARYVAAA